MKIRSLIDMANKSYAYLKYIKIKNNSDNVESFILKVKSLKVRRYMKNLIYENYPIEECTPGEQDLLFKENMEMIKKMPADFFKDNLNVLKVVNMGSGLDYIDYLPKNIINDKEFIVALMFKNKDAFSYLLKHLDSDILDDVEFLSYLTTFSNRIALSLIDFRKDVKFNEKFVEQLLKDKHEPSELYFIKENLLYQMVTVSGSNEKKLDPYAIRETLKLLDKFDVNYLGYYYKTFTPLLDYSSIFEDGDNKLLKEFKKEITDDIEKYFKKNSNIVDLNVLRNNKKVYIVNDENGESLMDEAIKRNPLLFMFFSSEKLINQDNINLIKSQENKEFKFILAKHMISIILSEPDYLKKYGKEMEYLFSSEFIDDERIHKLSHRKAKGSFYDWIMNLKAIDVPNGLTVDKYALTLFKFYDQDYLTFKFNDSDKKLKSNWKNIFKHLDEEFKGNVKEFKTFISSHNLVPDDVILEIIKSMDNKPGGEEFLREIINSQEREGGLLNNELFMKYSDMNINALSREEKIDKICSMEKNIAVARILLKNLDFFKSLRPENKKEFDIISKALPSLNNSEIELIDKSFYKNAEFIEKIVNENINIDLLKSKKFKENVDKSFFENDKTFHYLLKKVYYLHSVKKIYGENINNFRNFEFWKNYFKDSYVAIPELEADKKSNIEYFSFLTEENKIEILKDVEISNYFLMHCFYSLKIIDDSFIIRNIKEIMKNKNIFINISDLFTGEPGIGEDVKKNVFLEMINLDYSGEKMSSVNLNLMLRNFQPSMKEDNDIMFKFINLINNFYKGTFENLEANLFQSFMSNDKFKEVFENIYGKVSVLEVLSEDNLFFDKIITKWDEKTMLNDLNNEEYKHEKTGQSKIKNVKKF